MTKRPGRISLSDFVDGPDEAPPVPTPPAETPAGPAIVEVSSHAPSKLAQAAGIEAFVFHLSTADKRRMRIVAAETGLKLQDIGVEALNMWLAARGLPPLERVKANVPDGRKRR